mmetsp:Transcript_33760/g.93277  ORF Transcript_33760/g.93277 Transcript_33760/m.93277 type:complete len:127 (-) Transcript_33760:16-396(-)
MPQETQGFLVSGDQSALLYVRHVAHGLGGAAGGRGGAAGGRGGDRGQDAQERGLRVRTLDRTHLFCRGGAEVERQLNDKIDAFLSKNVLEPPEEQVGRLDKGPELSGAVTSQGRGRARKRAAPTAE